MKLRLFASCIALGLLAAGPAAHAQDEKFDIFRFDIQGNTLLPAEQAAALVAPFAGKGRVYGDIQKALEALENAYRAKGYGTVNVHVPEQEITSGVIRLDVSEAVLGKVTISGNEHFTTENVRASLPNLKEGQAPNLRQISENVQLINENPAKQVEVTLGASEEENRVDAKVALTEQNPQRFFVTLDNTGTPSTGQHRIGLAYQHANLLGNDEMLTLAYTASPDIWLGHPDDVKVDVYSVAFRKPFYGIGDSLDIIYGNSNVNTPQTQETGFGLTGKGEVLALRWNHLFPRRGEYTSRLVFGFDYKHINTTCDPDQKGLTSTCTPYTVRPVSATYSGQWQGIGYQAGYNVGLAVNLLPTGLRYPGAAGTPADGKNDRYSFVTNRPVSDQFVVLRFGGSYAQLVGGWQLRAALTGQLAGSALPSAEQFGLVGSSTVRGFSERAISADTGHVVNFEAYTPNLADKFGFSGNLHGVAFLDFAYGRNIGADEIPFDKISVASAGIGLRYALNKDVSFTWDAAQVVDPGHVTIEARGDWRSHFKLIVGF
jgi:hemolysin activation/secretion protein